MTIHNGSVIPARNCSQAGNRRNTLRWDLSPLEIRTMTDCLIYRVKKVYDDIGALKIENVSVENTLKVLANVKLDYACKSFSLMIFRYVFFFFMAHKKTETNNVLILQTNTVCITKY